MRCGGQRADKQEAACHRGTCPSRSWRWRPLALTGSTLPPQANPHILPEIWKQGLPLLQDASGQFKSTFRVREQGSKHSHSHTPMQRLAALLCLRIIPHSLSQPHAHLTDLGLGTRALGFCKPMQLVGMGSGLRTACLESLVYCMTCSKPHSEDCSPFKSKTKEPLFTHLVPETMSPIPRIMHKLSQYRKWCSS